MSLNEFYDHYLIQQNPETILTYGWAHGAYPSTNELLEAVAKDLVERRESQGIKSTQEPSILSLEPQRRAIQQHYINTRRIRDEHQKDFNKRRGESERYIRTEINRLTAIVDHDLSSGFGTLKAALAQVMTQAPNLTEQTRAVLAWMSQQIILCVVWQRSIVELGTEKASRLQSFNLASWLGEHIALLRDQLELSLTIEMEISDTSHVDLDAQMVLVACLHLLIAAQNAGASILRISSRSAHHHDDDQSSGLSIFRRSIRNLSNRASASSYGPTGTQPTLADESVLMFEDNGQDQQRLKVLQGDMPLSDVVELPWQLRGLVLLRRVLQLQHITLNCQYNDQLLQMIWGVPSQQGARNSLGRREIGSTSTEQTDDPSFMMPLSKLYSEIARFEQEIARFRAQTQDSVEVIRTTHSTVAQRLLLPYVQELESNLQKLVNRAEFLMTLEYIDIASAQRVVRISFYCYLLARNLVLALHGTELPLEMTDMNEQIRQVTELLEHKLSHMYVSLDLTPNLPSVSLASVEAKQILMNLIRNAAEATEPGGSMLVATSHTEDMVIIQIRDTGVGILPTYRDNIFNLNFSTKGRGTNSGVGLYIVKSIVDRAGGRIQVTSAILNKENQLIMWESGFKDASIFHWTNPGTVFQIEFPVPKE